MDDSVKKATFFNPKYPLTPAFIPLIFWLGVIVCVIMAIDSFVGLGIGLIVRVMALLTLGPLLWFVICELIAGFFHIAKNIDIIRQTKAQ